MGGSKLIRVTENCRFRFTWISKPNTFIRGKKM